MSMVDGVLVTFQSIQDGQIDVQNTVAAINQQSEDLQQYLAPLVSTWGGSASEQYQVLQKQWNTALTDLNQVLAQIAQALGVAYQNYTTTETANVNVWGS